MSSKTTIPHLILENHPHIASAIKIPEGVNQADLMEVHDYLYPILMEDYTVEWDAMCAWVDREMELGGIYFNVEDGTIIRL